METNEQPGQSHEALLQYYFHDSVSLRMIFACVYCGHSCGSRCLDSGLDAFESVPRLRSFTPLVPLVYRLISLARPGPSGSSGPSQLCRRCSHPPRRLPGSGCASSHPAAATAARGGLPPPSVIRASRRTGGLASHQRQLRTREQGVGWRTVNLACSWPMPAR
jgi:hypothetical protein